mmetsp:Transcript_71584/g.186183  ORF Transcript_71584/g.186183 Transcript_71584/m.186183 type:complete len:265 (+) Transcript_71584:403-1197(+)
MSSHLGRQQSELIREHGLNNLQLVKRPLVQLAARPGGHRHIAEWAHGPIVVIGPRCLLAVALLPRTFRTCGRKHSGRRLRPCSDPAARGEAKGQRGTLAASSARARCEGHESRVRLGLGSRLGQSFGRGRVSPPPPSPPSSPPLHAMYLRARAIEHLVLVELPIVNHDQTILLVDSPLRAHHAPIRVLRRLRSSNCPSASRTSLGGAQHIGYSVRAHGTGRIADCFVVQPVPRTDSSRRSQKWPAPVRASSGLPCTARCGAEVE